MSKTLVLIISIDDENREWAQVFICVHVYGLLHYQLHEYGVSSFSSYIWKLFNFFFCFF